MRIEKLLASLMPLFAFAACGGAPQHEMVAQGPIALPPANNGECSPLPEEPSTQRIVSLPAAEREALEKRLVEGPVGVKLEGCTLVVVPACELRASAVYKSQPAEASLTLSTEGDVEREMPIAKDRLAPALRGGAIQVKLVHAGRFAYGDATATPEALEACKGATHMIRGYTVGAFEVVQASGATMEKSGDREGCAKGTGSSAPPSGCGALVSMDLVAWKAGPDVSPTKSPEIQGLVRPRGPSPITSPITTTDRVMPDNTAEHAGEGEGGNNITGEGKDGGCEPRDPLCAYNRMNR